MNEQSCANCVYFQIDIDSSGSMKFDATKECKYKLPWWVVAEQNIYPIKKNPDTDGQFCDVFIERKEVTE